MNVQAIDSVCEKCGGTMWIPNQITNWFNCANCGQPLPSSLKEKKGETRVRVTRISKGKTFNLGNYENERLDVSVEIPEGQKASDVLSQLEQLFRDVDPKNEKDDYEVKQARALLARPAEYIERDDLIKIAAAKQTIVEHQRRKERMKTARNILDHLGSQSQYKDGKWSWGDEQSDDVPF